MTEAEGLKEERLKFSGKSGGKLGNANGHVGHLKFRLRFEWLTFLLGAK